MSMKKFYNLDTLSTSTIWSTEYDLEYEIVLKKSFITSGPGFAVCLKECSLITGEQIVFFSVMLDIFVYDLFNSHHASSLCCTL